MKFTVEQQQLNEAIRLVSRAISSSPTHPILGNILMRLEGDRLSLIGFDLSLGLKVTVDAQGKENGTICVPSKLLGDIVGRLNGELKFDAVEEGNVLHLKARTGKYKLSWLEAEEYPELPAEINEGQSLVFDTQAIAQAIKAVYFCASTEQTKQVLVGIHFRLTTDCLELAATDGHRLAVSKIEQGYQGEQLDFTIPAKALVELERMLKDGEDGGKLSLVFDESQAVFGIGDRLLTSRLLNRDYPAYQQLIPARFERSITVDRKELMGSVERLAIFSNSKEKIKPILLKIGQNAMSLSVESFSTAGEEEIPCQLVGEDVDLSFSTNYLLSALGAIASDEVSISINQPLSPAVICPVSGDKTLYLLMPVRHSD